MHRYCRGLATPNLMLESSRVLDCGSRAYTSPVPCLGRVEHLQVFNKMMQNVTIAVLYRDEDGGSGTNRFNVEYLLTHTLLAVESH